MAVVQEPLSTAQQTSSEADRIAALKKVKHLADLREQDYKWLAERGEEVHAEAGDLVFRQGEPANNMTVVLEGEIEVRRRIGDRTELFFGRAGELTGVLPFSRMTTSGGDGVVLSKFWGLTYPRTMFDEMVASVPSLGKRVVAILLDRVRELTRMEQQTEKLAALNKLAGNLAHELNNPASAAQRAGAHLQTELKQFGKAKFELGSLCLAPEKLSQLREWEGEVVSRENPTADALAASDDAASVERWLEQHNVPLDEENTATLADAGVTATDLDAIFAVGLPPDGLAIYLRQFALGRRTERIGVAVLDSTHRIYAIIDAIKDYAYLDQAPLQQVNIELAIRSTLAMLHSRLAKVTVVEKFAPGLPLISAFGSELNQVWMALLENALDAIQNEGRIEIRVFVESDWMLVQIIDDGPGIPEEIRNKIFEPFFTTKTIGDGLGLGLDTAMRVLRKHRGVVMAEQVPEGTCFQVRLPIEQWRAY